MTIFKAVEQRRIHLISCMKMKPLSNRFLGQKHVGSKKRTGAVISSLSERRISRHFRTPGLKLTNPRLFAITHGRNSPYLFQPVVFKPAEHQRLQKILSPLRSLITSNIFSINLFLSLREIINQSKGRVAISKMDWTEKNKIRDT